MSKPFHCPSCKQKLPVSIGLRITSSSKFVCPQCNTRLRPHRDIRSLLGVSAGAFMAVLTIMIGHLFLIVRKSDPLTTYIVMFLIAIVAFVVFAISTTKNAEFEPIGKGD